MTEHIMDSQDKRGKQVGQAQKNRRRNVRYTDVELELWELDADAVRKSRNSRVRTQQRRSQGGRGRKSSKDYGRIRPDRAAGNIRLYEERHKYNGSSRRGNIRSVRSSRKRRARRRRVYAARAVAALLMVLSLVLIYYMTGEIYRFVHNNTGKGILQITSEKTGKKSDAQGKIAPPEMTEDYLEISEYSRPGTKLKKVKNIFVHYTANPGTSAANNRSYFSNLALTKERAASAHLIIGYEGELIKCIPLNEQAYAVKTRNDDSISVECCYLSKEDGAFTQETYDTLIHTLAWLVDEYELSAEDILRHYDCGGKLCPLYYVEHEDAWEQLLQDVDAYIAEHADT